MKKWILRFIMAFIIGFYIGGVINWFIRIPPSEKFFNIPIEVKIQGLNIDREIVLNDIDEILNKIEFESRNPTHFI